MAAIRLTTSVVVLNASYCVVGLNGSRVTAFVFWAVSIQTPRGHESDEKTHHSISRKWQSHCLNIKSCNSDTTAFMRSTIPTHFRHLSELSGRCYYDHCCKANIMDDSPILADCLLAAFVAIWPFLRNILNCQRSACALQVCRTKHEQFSFRKFATLIPFTIGKFSTVRASNLRICSTYLLYIAE